MEHKIVTLQMLVDYFFKELKLAKPEEHAI